MTAKQAIGGVLGLSLGGTLFAGYLTFSSMVLKRCAFGETCPRLFGLPSCLFGFAFFLTLALVAGAASFRALEQKVAARILLVVAAGGTLFALRFAVPEIVTMFSGRRYAMGLPTCAWGLVFFIAALALSICANCRKVAPPVAPTAPTPSI